MIRHKIDREFLDLFCWQDLNFLIHLIVLLIRSSPIFFLFFLCLCSAKRLKIVLRSFCLTSARFCVILNNVLMKGISLNLFPRKAGGRVLRFFVLTKYSFCDKLISARLRSTSNKYFYDYAIERNVEEVGVFLLCVKKALDR